jgi:hypothetical protein
MWQSFVFYKHALVVFLLFLEKCFGVLAGGAVFGRVFAFVYISAVAAFPFGNFFAFKGFVLLEAGQ